MRVSVEPMVFDVAPDASVEEAETVTTRHNNHDIPINCTTINAAAGGGGQGVRPQHGGRRRRHGRRHPPSWSGRCY